MRLLYIESLADTDWGNSECVQRPGEFQALLLCELIRGYEVAEYECEQTKNP
jgi:hypothetical protein